MTSTDITAIVAVIGAVVLGLTIIILFVFGMWLIFLFCFVFWVLVLFFCISFVCQAFQIAGDDRPPGLGKC